MRILTLLLLSTVLVAAGCGGGDSATRDPAPASAGAPTREGGLSIDEALASELDGPLMVKGYVVAAEGGPVRLCSALLESFPPQCGEPSLVVEGLDLDALDGLKSTARDGGIVAEARWSEQPVSLLGTVEDGVLTVSAHAL